MDGTPALNTPSPESDSSGSAPRRPRSGWWSIRNPVPKWQAVLLGVGCVALCFVAWWLVTRGEPEARLVSKVVLPSPGETFASFHELWFERTLTRNVWTTLRRVGLGFLLAVAVGVPAGVVAGCFTRVEAFLSPLIIFGRNIPIAALIPLTFTLFGIDEKQKVLFIFLACVAFVIADTAQSIRDVDQRYIDTAYTLGASRLQTILKILVPLAMPNIFNSMRLLFGLAFGYIMLAETVTFGAVGGLGHLIYMSQRLSKPEHIYLIILIIPVLAFFIDRALFWVQRELFPHEYGGAGVLNRALRVVFHAWDDFKSLFWRPRTPEVAP